MPTPEFEPNLAEVQPVPAQYRQLTAGLIAKLRSQAHAGRSIDALIAVTRMGGETHFISMNANSVDSKDAAIAHARRLALTIEADFSVIIAEAWALPPSRITEAEAIYARYGSVAAYPGRLEVVTLLLETRYGAWTGQGVLQLKKGSKRRREIGPFVFHEGQGLGRFTGIIAKDPDAPKPNEAGPKVQ